MAPDKSLVPDFVTKTADLDNQPSYHFGEMFALRWYHENQGWLGFRGYALGFQYPGSGKRRAGRQKVEEIIPASKLARMRELRATEAFGSGEPDLFLYKPDGAFMFVDVKKSKDQIGPAQLTCTAQILAVLRCPVEITYLCTPDQEYQPKLYEFDLASLSGRRAD